MKPFEFTAPATLDEAVALLGAATRPFAGGTDLVTLMQADLAAPQRLVAVRSLLPAGVTVDAGTVTLGAATTLADIERDAMLASRFTALAQAARVAASPQLRNMATLGGNLLQRPRCWYFRNRHLQCWLKGGDTCPAREGQNRLHALFRGGRCVAVHPSDLASALLAFDAGVRIRGREGTRLLGLEALFALPEDGRRSETTLRDDELVLHVSMRIPAPETRSIYVKAMDRAAFAFALAGVAVVLRLSPRREVDHVRVVLAGVAPIPWRAHVAETALLGNEPSEGVLQNAADASVAGAAPLSHNGWKLPLVRTLVLRALRAVVD
jgi:xanthine dehydrogenase YagS FAD-binding subunit